MPARGEVANVNRVSRTGRRDWAAMSGRHCPVLALLLTGFLLATVRLPLKRIENLDSAALAAFACRSCS